MNAETFRQMHQKSRDYWWYRAKRQLIRLLLDDLLKDAKSFRDSELPGTEPFRIADLGCGTGAMFDVLSEYGDLFGLEPSVEAVSWAATTARAHLVQAESGRIPFRSESLDLVTMFDSLEHIDDDVQVVRDTFRIIRAGGYLIISVPAFQSLMTWRETQLGHKRRYSIKRLHRLLTENGFEVLFNRYMYAALFPLLLLKTLKDRFLTRPGTLRSDIAMPPEPLNTWLANWFCSEAHVCKRWGLPFGTSIVCVAKPVKDQTDGFSGEYFNE
jgi:SAM-dependent methyltransferase